MRPFITFDTATDHLAVGVGDLDRPGELLAGVDMPAPRAANTVLLSTVERVLAEAGLSPCDLAAVACGRGPGSFTGVRIGVATAKGLAHGASIPLAGFGTLDAVAWRAWRSGAVAAGALLGVLGDAMRGEVYPALFAVSVAGPERLTADRVAKPGDVAAEWQGSAGRIVLAGNALGKHRAEFELAFGRESIAPGRVWVPDAQALIDAAWAEGALAGISAIAAAADRAGAYADAHPGALLPVYTRLSDAEEAERARTAGGGSATSTPRTGVSGPSTPSGGAR